MDSAAYVPAVDKIIGCSGGYVHKCNAATGARESSAKIAAPVQGPSSITYHAADGYVYLGCWLDLGWVDEVNFYTSPRSIIYRVDAATMLGAGTVDILAAFASFKSVSKVGVNGIQAMFSQGDYLYMSFRYQSAGGNVARINPNNVAQKNINNSFGWTNWNVTGIDSDGANFYMPYPDLRIYQCGLDFTSIDTRCNTSGGGSLYTPVACAWGGSGDDVYVVCGNGNLLKITSFALFGPGTFAVHNLELLQANVKPWKIRRNSVDGLLYIPCQSQDVVIVWDPGSDTGVVKSGFDGPCDVVFTPTKKFAVQSGPVGLKEIT